MSKLSGFALIVAGVAAAAYVLPTATDTGSSDVTLADRVALSSQPQQAHASRATTVPVSPVVAPVVVPAVRGDKPAAAPSQVKTGSVALPQIPKPPVVEAPRLELAAPALAVLPAPEMRKIVVSKPTAENSRQQLTRDIQAELRRVGCFDGDVSGEWSSATKKGMKSFIDRINATLPIEEPDHILKTLVQGHPGSACGKTCPAGQGLSGDRCVPTAVLAQKSAPKRRVPSTRDTADAMPAVVAPAQMANAAPKTSSVPAQRAASASKATSQWETTVTAMAPLPIVPSAPRVAVSEALSGRMALSGPRTPQDDTAYAAAQKSLTARPEATANDQIRTIATPSDRQNDGLNDQNAAERGPRNARLAAVTRPGDEDESDTAPRSSQKSQAKPERERVERRSPPTYSYNSPRPRVIYYAPPAYYAQKPYFASAPRERSSFNPSIFARLSREGK